MIPSKKSWRRRKEPDRLRFNLKGPTALLLLLLGCALQAPAALAQEEGTMIENTSSFEGTPAPEGVSYENQEEGATSSHETNEDGSWKTTSETQFSSEWSISNATSGTAGGSNYKLGPNGEYMPANYEDNELNAHAQSISDKVYVRGQPFKVHIDSIEPEAGPTSGETRVIVRGGPTFSQFKEDFPKPMVRTALVNNRKT